MEEQINLLESEQELNLTEQDLNLKTQPESYSEAELAALRDFVNLIKNDESRVALACWGDHHDYSHGY